MNLDISIPNPIFQAASKLAQRLDLSLSELYTSAITMYMAVHDNDNITERLDEVYAEEESALEPSLMGLQVASIGED